METTVKKRNTAKIPLTRLEKHEIRKELGISDAREFKILWESYNEDVIKAVDNFIERRNAKIELLKQKVEEINKKAIQE